MASLYQDTQARIAIVITANANFIDYVQHSGKKVDTYHVPTKDFNKFFHIIEGGKTGPVDAAKKLLALANSGVSITPEAKQELQGIVAKAPLMEAPMAIPTSLPKSNGKTDKPKGKPAPQKLSELPVAKNTDDKISKLAPVAEATAPKAAHAPRAEKPEVEASDLVKQAQADADAMIAEAEAMLEEAKKKADEKKAGDAAKAEAKKIIEKAKAEVAKIKAAIAKLGKKGGRKAKAEGDGGERAPRDTEDISAKKIVQVEAPVVREGSARGELIATIYKCKTVKNALTYEGVRPQMIKQMVTKGYITLE
jgi:vacuolar-type H+-ATPase subunit H